MYIIKLLFFFCFLATCDSSSSCDHACDSISQALPQLYYSDLEARRYLWSKFQAQVQPLCRVEPRDSQDVEVILSAIRFHECHFAVIGGGTSPFKGASNAAHGITIDLRRMKDINFIDGLDPHVTVGAGSLWTEVYQSLQHRKMSATGTRNGLTGVVGSILGGGISFFSERHGWACDTVLEFELVLANSTTVKASQVVNADLFWALKGGGNNFGIVTKVTIETFRDPPRFYTFQLFNIKDLSSVFNRLQLHTAGMPAHVLQISTTFGWHVPTQSLVISERMVASHSPELPESIFHIAKDGTVEESPVLQTNIYERSVVAMAQKMSQMNKEGFFNFFGSVTVRNDARLCEAMAKDFQEEVKLIQDAENLQVNIVYNPLTLKTLRHMKKRGGNALGLSDSPHPLLVVNINLRWSNEGREEQMRGFMRRLIGRFCQTATASDMLHPYVFQNHAFEQQDVFPGYGKRNYDRLKAVRMAVDPGLVFQKLQPGFFKLEPQISYEVREKSEL